jgi:cobalt-zinc-cadmium efflux system membrane fusion protein
MTTEIRGVPNSIVLRVGLVLAVLCAGCGEKREGHEHATDHPEGHDHHAEGHGHGDGPTVRITRWTEKLELFAEHPRVVVGEEASFLAHLTVLDGFRALSAGKVVLELDGPSAVRVEVGAPARPGIFIVPFKVGAPGKYRGKLTVAGHVEDVIADLEIEAFPDGKGAVAEEEEAGKFIEFLKEQQWGVPFGTAFAASGTVVSAIEVPGVIDTPPGGSAVVSAPFAGRLVLPRAQAAASALRPGSTVKKGQLLALLAPAPASPEDAARADLTVAEADTRSAAARLAKERAERLFADQAISKKELEEAAREAALAEEAVRSARGARSLFSGETSGSGAGSWRMVAPMTGVLVDVRANEGAIVAPGDVVFRIVDARELWVKAQVAEQQAVRLRGDRDAYFLPSGLSEWLRIGVTGDEPTATLVNIGQTVDPQTRTVEVIYSLGAADPRLRVGALARVSVPVGEEFTGVVVPRGALVDDDGREVVYVQVDGEHFAERTVRTGPRHGGVVSIEQGVAAGERVVTTGAHLVRLASRSSSETPHGHIH